jgi:Cd2+/Zn2+-exporting ATPase
LSQPTIALVACLVAIALTISTPARRAWRALHGRSLDINVLMIIAVIGAGVLGDWLEGATVLWLFAISQVLESFSLDRARRSIRSLMALSPAEALVRRQGREQVVPAADVRVGEVVIVKPGERVPVDGRVLTGESSVDEAPVTGESWPVEKRPGAGVFAGVINSTGALEIETLRVAADSTVARIIHLVERAQATRAPMQSSVDRFARRYTPAVALLAALLAVVPPSLILLTGAAGGAGHLFGIWVYRALALLVVACPCALVISTPVSIVSGLTAAAREGVLIKGGSHLERLATIRCVAFDKTGTITESHVSVTEVLGVDGVSTDGVLSVAAALEARSEHPIGRAIVERARVAGLAFSPGDGFRALPGFGAEARVAQSPALVGSHRLFEERRMCTPSLHDRIDEVTARGETAVLVGHGGSPLGVIGLSGRTRAGGRDMVTALRKEGIVHVALLTGDRRESAEAARAAVGLDEAHSDLLPADKVRLIGELCERYGPVAMVGDGVNDAPALAAASIGVAMGGAGTDVALETADVALMSDDLSKLPFALRLSRATVRNIRANVGLALAMKVGFVVLAAAGLATLWMAIVADTGASLLVTANSLRLLRLRAERG